MSGRPTRLDRLRGDVDPPDRPARKPALGRGLAGLVADATPAILPPFRYIPLDRLVFSDLNVRKTDTDAAIEELAADIEAHGLITNVVVAPELDGAFGLLDGQRRVQALRLLAGQGKLAGDAPVPALVRENAADGREISLATAVTRVALNPADEVEAYAAVVAAHADDAEDPVIHCARRFGRTPNYVAQRLRLAALAPEILDALRDGSLGERAAQAYAAVPDQKLQLQVFTAEQDRAYGTKHDPKNIRDTLRNRTYAADCKQARYVGLEAYLAAGGRAERDLWMLPGEPERLLDPALIDRLAREKGEAELPRLAKRDGFAAGRLTVGFTIMPIWPKVPAGFTGTDHGPTPPDHVRIAEGWIGLYELAGDTAQLGLRSWWRPDPPLPLAPAPAAAPIAAAERAERLQAMVAEIDGSADQRRADTAADARREFEVAQDVAKFVLQVGPDAARIWPSGPGWLERLADDGDHLLVALQIRVPRDTFAIALQERIDADNDANDRVTQAEGESTDA